MTSLEEVGTNNIRLPLWDQASAEFCFAKSRELLTKPFLVPKPPHNSLRDISYKQNYRYREPQPNYNLYASHTQRVPRSECMSRKTYSSFHKTRPTFSIKNRIDYLEPPFPVYEPESSYENTCIYDRGNYRQRALSFSDTPHMPQPRKTGRSIRDRNRRRQSYNPHVYDSSSSDSECASYGSADADWRRRRRLSSLSVSNSSIRSEINRRPNFLRPESAGNKSLGRSPPPSNTILSGLSPTTAARCALHSDSTSSDSDI